MKQLTLFDTSILSSVTRRKVGRRNKVTPKIVFDVVEALKLGKSNKIIISQHQLTERTFFRIKKGEYSHLLKEYIKTVVDDLNLQ